jgi:hypothetical protein
LPFCCSKNFWNTWPKLNNDDAQWWHKNCTICRGFLNYVAEARNRANNSYLLRVCGILHAPSESAAYNTMFERLRLQFTQELTNIRKYLETSKNMFNHILNCINFWRVYDNSDLVVSHSHLQYEYWKNVEILDESHQSPWLTAVQSFTMFPSYSDYVTRIASVYFLFCNHLLATCSKFSCFALGHGLLI